MKAQAPTFQTVLWKGFFTFKVVFSKKRVDETWFCEQMKIYAIAGSHLWKSPLKRIFPNQSVQLQQLLRCLHNISQRYWEKPQSYLTLLNFSQPISSISQSTGPSFNWSAGDEVIAFNNLINFAPIQLLVKSLQSLQYGEIISIQRAAVATARGGARRAREQGRSTGQTRRFWIFWTFSFGTFGSSRFALIFSKPCKTLPTRWACSWRRWFLTTGSRSLPPWPGFSPQPSSPSFSGFSSSSSSWATMRTGTGTGRADDVEI